jgi:hypothetical protein
VASASGCSAPDITSIPPDVSESGQKIRRFRMRKAVRQMRSRPMVEALHVWLQEHLPRVPGWSDLAKAMRYALRHWDGLILYLGSPHDLSKTAR